MNSTFSIQHLAFSILTATWLLFTSLGTLTEKTFTHMSRIPNKILNLNP